MLQDGTVQTERQKREMVEDKKQLLQSNEDRNGFPMAPLWAAVSVNFQGIAFSQVSMTIIHKPRSSRTVSRNNKL